MLAEKGQDDRVERFGCMLKSKMICPGENAELCLWDGAENLKRFFGGN